MPHHPAEETAGSGLTDKIAQHSKDSTASDHPLHDENKGAFEQGSEKDSSTEQGKPSIKDLSSKGPQIPQGDLPPAKSKEELLAEAKRLNS